MGDTNRVVLRERARQDVEAAVDWYRDEAGEEAALRFVNAVEAALAHGGRYPSSGSARYSLELEIPGLRSWQLERFPYLAFYVERADYVDVWRVLQVTATSHHGCTTPTSRSHAVKPARDTTNSHVSEVGPISVSTSSPQSRNSRCRKVRSAAVVASLTS